MTNNDLDTLTQRLIAVNVQSTVSSFVSLDNRPSSPTPLMRAEEAKRRYINQLNELLSAYEAELRAIADSTTWSERYKLGEIAAYIWRLVRVADTYEKAAADRAAQAELAEHGSARLNKQGAEPKEQPTQ